MGKKQAEKNKTGEEKMDVDSEMKEKIETEEKKEEEKEKEKKEPEATFEMLANPARVMKAQLKVTNPEDGKYRPMKDISIGGIVLLDNTSGEVDEVVEPMEVNKETATTEEEGEEPSPPEPFQWSED